MAWREMNEDVAYAGKTESWCKRKKYFSEMMLILFFLVFKLCNYNTQIVGNKNTHNFLPTKNLKIILWRLLTNSATTLSVFQDAIFWAHRSSHLKKVFPLVLDYKPIVPDI